MLSRIHSSPPGWQISFVARLQLLALAVIARVWKWSHCCKVVLLAALLGITLSTQAAANGGPTILPDATVNMPYVTIATGNLIPDSAASVTAGTLPEGITFNPVSAALVGIPTSVGTSTFTVTFTPPLHSPLLPQEITYSLEVKAAPLTMSPATGALSAGSVGTLYSRVISASGGTAPYSYQVTGGSLPAGMSMIGDEITGTPTASGNYSFTVTATDDASPGTTDQADYTLTINSANLAITPEVGSLTPGQIGQPYSYTVGAVGGFEPYTFSMSGAPDGLSIDPATGVISGTPTEAGAFTVSVEAEDSDGGLTKGSGFSSFNLTINHAELDISPEPGLLGTFEPGQAVSASFTATGGSAPVIFTLSSSILNGLSLNQATGVLSGTIPANTPDGVYSLAITATDSGSGFIQKSYTIRVSSAPVDALSIAPASGALANATQGENYSQSITTTGGATPVTLALANGNLPSGLTFNPASGLISGTVASDAKKATYSFTIAATDSRSTVLTAVYTITVVAPGVTVEDKTVEVPAGSTPLDVNLTAGATGGPFTDALVAFVEPANAGVATIIRGRLAALAPVEQPLGWYLQFKPNPMFTGTAKVGYRLISSQGTSNTGAITYVLTADAEEVASEINGLVQGFVQTRQGLISSNISIPSLMDRRHAAQASDPVSVTATPSNEGMLLGFASSLTQVDAARDAAEGIIASDPSRFNAWVEGTLLAHKRDDNAGRWGNFAMVSAGADYLLSQRLLLGVSVHYDRMSDPTDHDAKLTGNGWLAGPYASFAIGERLFWDTSVRYGGSSNDIDTAFWDGKFDTTRWLIDTAIKGQWVIGEDTILTPKLRAVYFNEKVETYSVFNGTGDEIQIDGLDTEQFRASLGAEIARSFTLPSGFKVTPKLGATLGYAGLDESGAFGSFTAGVSVNTGNDFTIDGGLLFNLSNGGSQSVGAKASIAKRF